MTLLDEVATSYNMKILRGSGGFVILRKPLAINLKK